MAQQAHFIAATSATQCVAPSFDRDPGDSRLPMSTPEDTDKGCLKLRLLKEERPQSRAAAGDGQVLLVVPHRAWAQTHFPQAPLADQEAEWENNYTPGRRLTYIQGSPTAPHRGWKHLLISPEAPATNVMAALEPYSPPLNTSMIQTGHPALPGLSLSPAIRRVMPQSDISGQGLRPGQVEGFPLIPGCKRRRKWFRPQTIPCLRQAHQALVWL